MDGKAQGRGLNVWRALINKEWKETKYAGEMKDGKWHGHGIMVVANGNMYEVDWKDGKAHGTGVYVGANGDR